jgi:hypothetical protein
VWAVLAARGKLPAIGTFRDFVNVWNSRGGNIIVLLALSLYSFRVAMRFFYHVVGLISSGKLDEKSATMMLGVQFVTGSVFGLFAGALIKTMTGSEGGTITPAALPPNTEKSVIVKTESASPKEKP